MIQDMHSFSSQRQLIRSDSIAMAHLSTVIAIQDDNVPLEIKQIVQATLDASRAIGDISKGPSFQPMFMPHPAID